MERNKRLEVDLFTNHTNGSTIQCNKRAFGADVEGTNLKKIKRIMSEEMILFYPAPQRQWNYDGVTAFVNLRELPEGKRTKEREDLKIQFQIQHKKKFLRIR